MNYICKKFTVSQRRDCRTLDISRSSHRYKPLQLNGEEALTNAIIELVREYGRYGYRRITAVLNMQGWHVIING